MIYEGVCKKCGETFNPQPSISSYTPEAVAAEAASWVRDVGFTKEDLEHGMNNAQTEVCGGQGELTGSWG